MKKRLLFNANYIDSQDKINKVILQLAKKRGQVIYGARSIQAQNDMFARNTKDYDIYDKNPKQSAHILQKQLDKAMGFDYFYSKEAEHKGTWKVKSDGADLKRNTPDDESIVDYTEMPSGVPTITINGLRYRKLKEELKKKQATVKDKNFKFRHEKDKDDIRRIKGYLKVRRLWWGD